MREVKSTQSVRDSFVYRFGEEQAQRLEDAAQSHKNGVHDNPGSDPFKWAVVICIGAQCCEVERYRIAHEITVPFSEFEDWVKTECDIASHDGDVDYLALFAGTYNRYLPQLNSSNEES